MGRSGSIACLDCREDCYLGEGSSTTWLDYCNYERALERAYYGRRTDGTIREASPMRKRRFQVEITDADRAFVQRSIERERKRDEQL